MELLRRAKRAFTAEAIPAETPSSKSTDQDNAKLLSNNKASARIQKQAITLHFTTGSQVYAYVSTRATSTLNGRATHLRIPDHWFSETEPIRVFQNQPVEGSNVVIVGYQNHITTLNHTSLMEILKVVGDCYTGGFDLMVHKMNSDVKMLTSISPLDRYNRQLGTINSSTDVPDVPEQPQQPKQPKQPEQNPKQRPLPDYELLQISLGFAHSSLTVLPSDTMFMDILGNLNVSFEDCGKAFLNYILDGHPLHFGAILSPQSLHAMTLVMSLIRYSLVQMAMPLIPTPVLQTFGEYFESNGGVDKQGNMNTKTLQAVQRKRSSTFDSGHSLKSAEEKKRSLLKSSTASETTETNSTETKTTTPQPPGRPSRLSRPNSVQPNPLKRPLSITNPASMTLLMIPERDRDHLLLVVSLFSRILLNVKPYAYNFLMPLVGMFYEAVVDTGQSGNTPLFVAGLIREFESIARAEASRASLMIRRTQGTTVLQWTGDESNRQNKQKLINIVKQWSTQQQRDARHYARRLIDLVCASVEGTDPAQEQLGDDDDGGGGGGGDEGHGSSISIETTAKAIVDSLNSVFERASPVIPQYVWQMLKRCPGYFGKDDVTLVFVVQSIVHDMVTAPRVEILRQLHRLREMLFVNQYTSKVSSNGCGTTWVNELMCDLIAPYNICGTRFILKVFDSCADLRCNSWSENEKKLSRLSLTSTFEDMHNQMKPVVAAKDHEWQEPGSTVRRKETMEKRTDN